MRGMAAVAQSRRRAAVPPPSNRTRSSRTPAQAGVLSSQGARKENRGLAGSIASVILMVGDAANSRFSRAAGSSVSTS